MSLQTAHLDAKLAIQDVIDHWSLETEYLPGEEGKSNGSDMAERKAVHE